MDENGVSDVDYIRSKLDSKQEVLVQKIDNGAVMTAYAYGSDDTPVGSAPNRDSIQCKWQDENGSEWDDTFNIHAFERAEY